MREIGNHFGSRLRLARLLKGWTQKDLGEHLVASRQYVHQLESGAKKPSEEVFSLICESLGINSNFFSINAEEIKADQCHFRKRRTTTNILTNRVLAFATSFETLVAFLERYIDIEEFRLDEIATKWMQEHARGRSCDDYTRADIESIAIEVRKTLGLRERAPISSMVRVLECSGVVVTTYHGVSEKVDALSLNERHPIVIRNTAKQSACRMRFDLAHELGHLILHKGMETGDQKTEAEADHFASSFLFPRAAFVDEFRPCLNFSGRFIWENIRKLKLRWKISQKAIIYRAHSLGLIDSRQYRTGNVTLNREGQAKVEALDDTIELEKPEFLHGALDFLKENQGLDFRAVAKAVGIEPYYLAEMLEVELPDIAQISNNVAALPPKLFSV